jgi:hypothetical protein
MTFSGRGRIEVIAPLTALLLSVSAASCGDSNPSELSGRQETTNAAPVAPPVKSDPGPTTIHRLNRTEYNNTVRDLLGDTTRPADAFPADNVATTFDNNADVLSIPAVLLEDYANAAESLVTTALGTSNPVRATIFTCDPTKTDHDSCARQILSAFGKRAWRRPLTADEVTGLLGLETATEQDGADFAGGIGLALEAILVSPYFLFRVELDADPNSTTPRWLNDYELATRLSYFIYASMPDDALTAAADNGELQDPVKLTAQVTRMLADTKASALGEDFAAQWLYTRTLPAVVPSPAVYPSFDEPLRSAMAQETTLFFQEFLNGDHDFADMVDADFTFVNARLATHYGLTGVTGSGFQKVSVAGSPRGGGLLAQASILTVTSTPTRPSIPRRGKFVLSELLCAPPPDPPPGIPTLPAMASPGQTERQALEQVTGSSPVCAGCHTQLNPLGEGLEHFDGIGAMRATDNGRPIDATGKLADGTTFDGNVQLAQALKREPALTRCVTQKLFTYALGREPTPNDQPVIDKVIADVGQKGNHLSDLILRIVTDDTFAARRGGAQ